MNAPVIAMVVKASLLLAAAAAVNALLHRRLSAASRHLVWTLALGGVLLLPVLSLAVPTWGIPVRVAALVPLSATTPRLTPDEFGPAGAPAVAAGLTEFPAEPGTAPARAVASGPPAAPLPETAPTTMRTKANVALVIYGLGALLLGLRLAMGRWTLGRLVRRSAEVSDPSWRELLRECESKMGRPRPVRLLRSLDRTMPMAFGLRTPTILIPAIADTWSEDRRRAVLLHELAHIDRGDCFTQLLAEVACAAYWMHPAVWWVAQRLRVERELACDDRVLSAGALARDYAGHLLELAYSLGGYRSPALVVSMARPRQLEGRMLAVLDTARNRVTPPLRARVVGLLAAVALVVPLAGAEAVMSPTAPEMTALKEWPASVTSANSEASSESALTPAPAFAAAPAPAAPDPSAPAQAAPAAPVAAPAPAVAPAPAALGSMVRPAEQHREIELPGTWEVRPSDDPRKVHLRLSERPNSTHGFDIAVDQLDGLPSSLLTGSGGAATFRLRRDAGTIVFEGAFRSGVGAGTFDFTPSQTFPGEMVKRGFNSPTKTEQYELARANIGFAYLDELNAQKYERPSLDDLVRAANHGVGLDYLQGMGGVGYRLSQIGALIRTRDHGVTPAYVRAMADEGLKNLSAEDLVRARDHGVTPQYAATMRAFGHEDLSLDELVRARDHGVSAEFVRGMAGLGFDRLSLGELARARDHGVTPEFAKAMREAGYGIVSIEELVKARDHGVSAEFARSMTDLGPERPSLGELAQARDHGVGAEFAKAWRDLGYLPILADMIRPRDHGVSAEFIASLKTLGYERLSVDELVRLRDHGVSASFVREQNSNAKNRLSVEELVRRRDGRW